MMNRIKTNLSLVLLFIVVSILVACSSSTETKHNQDLESVEDEVVIEVWDESGEPVTVKVLYPWGEDAFVEHIVEKYKDEIPQNITLECVCVDAQLESLQEMNANGVIPDMIFANWGIDPLVELDMLEPVDEFVKKYDVDVNEFNQSVIATYRGMDPEGKNRLIGMPTFVDTVGLFF